MSYGNVVVLGFVSHILLKSTGLTVKYRIFATYLLVLHWPETGTVSDLVSFFFLGISVCIGIEGFNHCMSARNM